MAEPWDNPFLLVYDKLWEMVKADPRFIEVVKENNRIDLNAVSRNPFKLNPSSADHPEVVLITPGASDGNYRETSSTSMLTRQYSWLISTGDFRVRYVLATEWALFAAMEDWCSQLTTLTWRGESFVKQLNFSALSEGLIDELTKNSLNGWSASFTIDVEMHFSRTALLPE
jgi:hypothetical protein